MFIEPLNIIYHHLEPLYALKTGQLTAYVISKLRQYKVLKKVLMTDLSYKKQIQQKKKGYSEEEKKKSTQKKKGRVNERKKFCWPTIFIPLFPLCFLENSYTS
jgi:hypothetical protein